MNRRQARIEALKTATGVLQHTDMGTFLCYLNDEDSLKCARELDLIIESLEKKWARLEKAK